MLGGFIVGVIENLRRHLRVIGTELKLTVALVLIIGVLVVRPSGLFGTRHGARGSDDRPRAATLIALAAHRVLAGRAARCRSRRATSAFQFTQVCVYAIALLGLNILTGYNGQISLGHGAFYAIGAYTPRS